MSNETLPLLEGERVVVRMGREEDVPEIVAFYERNEEFFSTTTTRRPPEFFTPPFWRAKVAQAASDYAEDRALGLFAFERERPARVIAAVNFFAFIRGQFHACILGYSLDEAVQGRGLMHESLELAIGFVFGELNMHRIMANYWPENVRSGAVLNRLGFEREGYARNYLRINGIWRDHHLTALTNDKWKG